ncbi:MAG: alpha-glucan family phosphorylase [Verrucomicrobiota bacterium]|nr:alpha-glucan family phosphorylase [Verrucomicrobiota bacterium]
MEIALEEGMPTYSGGLGILAGDSIRSAAGLKIPLVAVSLLHRKGYFHQRLNKKGQQVEEPVEWPIQDFLKERSERVEVTIENRTVEIRAWEYRVQGPSGFFIPVYFLDTDLSDNAPEDRTLTHFLYGGDTHYRLCQEVILGIGGIRMLQALGFNQLTRIHMNEGHASLVGLELLEQAAAKRGGNDISLEDVEQVRKLCVFTTHTPVASGHDKFKLDLVKKVLDGHPAFQHKDLIFPEKMLNMTYLALNLSHYINGVGKRHREVSQLLFAKYTIDSITNGVHVPTWTSDPFQRLFDRYIPGWKNDNFTLRYALQIPKAEIWEAHTEAKSRLLELVNRQTNLDMQLDCFTIGFARRAAAYKRGDLIFSDLQRLREIVRNTGKIQLIFSGKAHPQDKSGKEVIFRIFKAIDALKADIKIAYLEEYDIDLAKHLTSGVDLWLNTPQVPLEASGTSGMKAALNGVPSFSVLDGWWIEGCIEGITGWAIASDNNNMHLALTDAELLYIKLEQVILPLFYHHRSKFIDIMTHSIALNGSFFNTDRMMQQYVMNAYFR